MFPLFYTVQFACQDGEMNYTVIYKIHTLKGKKKKAIPMYCKELL